MGKPNSTLRRRKVTLTVNSKGQIEIPVKALHRALDFVEPLFVAAQRKRPGMTQFSAILTNIRDLRAQTDCQKTMTARY